MSEREREAALKELLAEVKARTEVSEAHWRVLQRLGRTARFVAKGEATLGLGDDVDTTDEEEAA